MKNKNGKQAFTLVEIAIVVAIIGLLAAIAIPSFKHARANSIAKAKANNVRLVNAAIEQHAMEYALTNNQVVPSSDYLSYIKNASAGLKVGNQDALLPDGKVGTDLTVSDLYE